MVTATPSPSSPNNCQLSAELWQHVFSFFLSNDHPIMIDGATLRSASRVNKSWKKIVESKDLWNVVPADYSDSQCDEGGDTKNKDKDVVSSSSSVHRSLQMTEEWSRNDEKNGGVGGGGGSFVSKNGTATLMGFVNLGRVHTNGQGSTKDDDHELQFLVRERSSGQRWILVISAADNNGNNNNNNKHGGDHHSDSLLSELYHGHRMMGEKFLSPSAVDYDYDKVCHRIPQGISSWSGRVVRWYRPITTTITNRYEQAVDLQPPKFLKRIDSHKQSLNVMLRHEHDQWETNLIRRRGQRQDNDSSTHHHHHHRYRPPFKTWVTLVDWMAQICECFDLPDDCLSLATSILDTYLSKSRRTSVNPRQRSSSKYLQLTAGTCVVLASKCKSRTGDVLGSSSSVSGDSPLLNRRDVALCADNIFTEKEVLLMERSILISLGWKLAILTPLDFLNVFSEPSGSNYCEQPYTMSPIVRSMSCYILETVLQTDICLRYRPSVIAGASILLAHSSLRDENGGSSSTWSEQSEMMTPFSFPEVAQAAVSMSRAIGQVRLACPQLSVIKRRYEKLERYEVGKKPIVVLPFDHGT